MSVIKGIDRIQSTKDALQFVFYYHPKDFFDAMHHAY